MAQTFKPKSTGGEKVCLQMLEHSFEKLHEMDGQHVIWVEDYKSLLRIMKDTLDMSYPDLPEDLRKQVEVYFNKEDKICQDSLTIFQK